MWPFDSGDQASDKKAFTIADLLAELPAGAQIYSVTGAATGKTVRAVPPTYALQPGDSIDFLTASGTHKQSTVIPDGTDISEPTDMKAPKAEPKTPEQIRADAAAAAQGRQDVTQPGKDAQTVALAKTAQAKINAGRMPTSLELAALEKMATTQQVTGTAAWLAQQLKAGKGTQSFGTGSNWNDHEQGQDVAGQYGDPVPLIRGVVTGKEDWGYGDYAVTIHQDDGTEVTIGHIQNPGHLSIGQRVTEADTVSMGGLPSAISSGPQVEIRVKQNGQYVDPAQYVADVGSGLGGFNIGALPGPNKQRATISGKEYVFDPTTGKFTATGLGDGTKPDILERNGKTYQYNPTSDTWHPATGLPDDLSKADKVQQALQQHSATVDYIKAQLASGAIKMDEANQYSKANDAYLAAGLRGATPFELQKQQQEMAFRQASIGKDLINSKLTEGASLASSLMRDYTTSMGKMLVDPGDYNPLTYARLQTEDNSGGPAMSDLAQRLVQSISPQNTGPNFAAVPAVAGGAASAGGNIMDMLKASDDPALQALAAGQGAAQ